MDPITVEVYQAAYKKKSVWRLRYVIPPTRSETGRRDVEKRVVRQDGDMVNFQSREEAVRFAATVLHNPVVNP